MIEIPPPPPPEANIDTLTPYEQTCKPQTYTPNVYTHTQHCDTYLPILFM